MFKYVVMDFCIEPWELAACGLLCSEAISSADLLAYWLWDDDVSVLDVASGYVFLVRLTDKTRQKIVCCVNVMCRVRCFIRKQPLINEVGELLPISLVVVCEGMC